MKTEYTAEQQATITTATATIKAAAHESVTAIVRAKAHLTIVIREQVAELEAAGIGTKDIAAIVRDSMHGMQAKPHQPHPHRMRRPPSRQAFRCWPLESRRCRS
jgi:hypothetical protein